MKSRSLTQLIASVFRYRLILAGGLALVLLATAAGLFEPRLFGYAIDQAVIPHDRARLQQLALFFLGIECVRVAAMIGQAYLFEVLGQNVMQDLRLKVVSHLQSLPVSTYDKNPAGRLVTRITNDVAALAEMFSSGFLTMIGNVLTLAGILAWLLILDFKLGLIAGAIFPVMMVAVAYFSKKLGRAYRDARSRLSALNAFLAENILGIRVIHLFGRVGIHLERFARINQWYADAQISSVRVFAYFQPTITWCSGASLALIVWFGGLEAWHGRLSLGVLVAFLSYGVALFQPMREIADKWNIFLSGLASAERIFSIFEWKSELSEAEMSGDAKPLKLRGEIEFRDVWFAYEGENWVLKDFSLKVAPGEVVGIVGHTGAGKTTLIQLLMRFYEPQRGQILIDGRDIRELDRRALRSAIGIIQQDVFLFSGNLDENVTLWRELTPTAERALRPALARIGAERDLGLEERGSNLSSGQRQILAFARAQAAEPSIWILDEATANVDSHSESELMERLTRDARGKTAFVIAHRLATVAAADQILVLHQGRLVESGKHRELIERDGAYARLYRYQDALAEGPAFTAPA